LWIAEDQIAAGDITGAKTTLASALKTAELVYTSPLAKEYAEIDIARDQAGICDITAAHATLENLAAENPGDLTHIANIKKEVDRPNYSSPKEPHYKDPGIHELIRASRVATALQAPTPPSVHLISTADWLTTLDGGFGDCTLGRDCGLNTNLFLDLTGYLKSLPPSDRPQTVFENLHATAAKLVRAQNVIDQMLKQQARK
jgi:hypothetical protein